MPGPVFSNSGERISRDSLFASGGWASEIMPKGFADPRPGILRSLSWFMLPLGILFMLYRPWLDSLFRVPVAELSGEPMSDRRST